ncbi:hypothetical protein [Reichenbachiella ulvae]|uniref:Uncharacterized protein n=1 Tax=Reichenbachiella ulvae TaxID=2980104 RepID=A0ABT3CSE1_9BACT|nr:hypothetical protein [Reichenbachiella ulvae]MCV9386491.1 hypothetical protein [Reichenbachiella ulvae]
MDDSNIYYYIVLGVIYLISRALKKKKPEQTPTESSSDEWKTEDSSQPSTQPSFEDLFKQITGQDYENQKEKEMPKPKPVTDRRILEEPPTFEIPEIEIPKSVVEREPVVQKEKEPELSQEREPIVRKKHVYERSENFAIEEEQPDVGDEVLAMLHDEDEVRKAIVFKEIFDRKY